jgi:hypothetical protein
MRMSRWRWRYPPGNRLKRAMCGGAHVNPHCQLIDALLLCQQPVHARRHCACVAKGRVSNASAKPQAARTHQW